MTPQTDDWKIVRTLRANPRKHYDEVAKELRISSRTVRRRTEKMIDGKAIFILPDLDLNALEGTVKVSLVIEYAKNHVKHEVDRAIMARYERFLSFPLISDNKHASFVFNLPNLPLAEEMSTYIAGIAGVSRVWMRPILSFMNLLGQAFESNIALRTKELTIIQRTALRTSRSSR